MRSAVRLRIRLAVGVAAVAAVVATGAFGVVAIDTITTIAGTGQAGFSGDAGQATSATLNTPAGVALDGQGSVFVADLRNNRVRKVSRDGTISTFAGTGEPGFSGDGGPATSARLNSPEGVAVDGQGNVYIADRNNSRVRRVSNGRISTFAGSGRCCVVGDGGPATAATLRLPDGVAVDGKGNVYIVDRDNLRVRKVNSGGTITTIAGTGVQGFSGDGGPASSAQVYPSAGVAVDGQGNVYIADYFNNRVRKISAGGTISTFAGTGGCGSTGDGGPATSARVCGPRGVAVDGPGNVYIADTNSSRVRKVSPAGTITTFAGTGSCGSGVGNGGPATRAELCLPSGVAVDGQGAVYIVETNRARVRKVTVGAQASALTLTLGGPSPQPLLTQKSIIVTARCNRPCSLAANGSVTIVGTRNVFGLTRASANLTAAGSMKLTLRFSAVAQRQFRLFLKPGQRAQAKITVKATDTGGHIRSSIRIVPIRSSNSNASTVALTSFVDRVAAVLTQSASGRRELGSAIAAGFNCSISGSAAGARVDRVVSNRKRLLAQLRGLSAPSQQAGQALALLRLGLQHSIEADIHYRDGFLAVGTSGCPLPPSSNFTRARQSDVRASAAKQRFVAAFNPLARRSGRRTWSASEI